MVFKIHSKSDQAGTSPMKLRCRHCHLEFAVDRGQKHKKCPGCGRIVVLPDQVRPAKNSVGKHPLVRRFTLQGGQPATTMAMAMQSMFNPHSWMGRAMIAIVVVAILGCLLIDVPAQRAVLKEDSARTTARKELSVMRVAIERFRVDCGRYPSTEEGLAALVRRPVAPGWDGHYITFLRPDPWKRAYVYRRENDEVQLFSLGPDGLEKTIDDVNVKMKPEQMAPYLFRGTNWWLNPGDPEYPKQPPAVAKAITNAAQSEESQAALPEAQAQKTF